MADDNDDKTEDEKMISDAQRRCEESQAKADAKSARKSPHPLGEDGEELLGSIWHNMMVNHARHNDIPVGKAKCETCGTIREWGDEPTCGCELQEAQGEAQTIRRSRADAAIESIIPAGMRWAKFGNEGWAKVEKQTPELREFARKWTREAGSALIIGPTGCGKTAACCALMRRILEASAKLKTRASIVRWAHRMMFVDAAAIVVARRNAKLGDEAGLIDKVKAASLLIIDELGFETNSAVPFEIVNARYMLGAPTIITSGRKCKKVKGRLHNEFEQRYGAAFMRRITDRGNVINLWDSEQQ